MIPLVLWIISCCPLIEEQLEINKLNLPQLVAYRLELFDTRERTIYWHNSDAKSILEDTFLMWIRYEKLKDAPKLWTHLMFPLSVEQTRELYSFNRAYRLHLENCMEVQTNPVLFERLSAEKRLCELLYKIYDDLGDSKKTFYKITDRREALMRLQQNLDKFDEKWFYQGVLPSHVPFHTFIPIR